MKKSAYIILLILVISNLSTPVFKFTGNLITNYLVKHDGRTTKAIVIDELNYKKNRSLNSGFSYSYLFIINSKKYKNDTRDSTLKVGDTIEIVYYKNDPSINKPLHPKE